MSDRDREITELRAKLKSQTDRAANNDAILRRSQARELDLLTAQNLPELLDCMTEGMTHSFGLAAVTVVICDPQHEIRHLLVHSGEFAETNRAVIFVDALTGMTPQYATMTKPWLGPFSRPDHALIFPGITTLGSVGMVPLMRQSRLIGTMNFGSADVARFTRAHATDFLEHLGVIASFSMENSVNRARLLRSGFTDVLTGWHNRRYLQTRLHEELNRAQREEKTLTCLMLDIDHFKLVNDSFGHLAGDVVLSEVVHRIEAEIRATDVAARYGGEEFVILLPNTEKESARIIAERIRKAVVASPFVLPTGNSHPVTVSLGMASLTPAIADRDLKSLADGLLAAADVALYQSKSAGRNRVSG